MDASGDSADSNCCVKPCVEEGGDCCDDTALSAALDYDGLTSVSIQKDQVDVSPLAKISTISAIVTLVKNDRVVLSDTGPPLSGQLLRIRYQSFLC